MNTHIKKLYRSETDALVWGVLGGLGEYSDIDPTVLRLGYIILALITGIFPCIIAYVIAYFIIPERPIGASHESMVNSQKEEERKVETEVKTKTAPLTHTEDALIKKEMEAFDIKNEDKEKFAPGERPTPEVAVELAIPEDIGELKKPNWPDISKKLIDDSQQKETATIDSLTEENKGVNLHDVM